MSGARLPVRTWVVPVTVSFLAAMSAAIWLISDRLVVAALAAGLGAVGAFVIERKVRRDIGLLLANAEHMRAAADCDGFRDRLENTAAFRAHVRRVAGAIGRCGFAHSN